ncbi:hypothetical protein Vadar_011026 [Vaccinium darrowii]|nr:hypothetical protein Vadar_011026 [Vaccinium darrowii]
MVASLSCLTNLLFSACFVEKVIIKGGLYCFTVILVFANKQDKPRPHTYIPKFIWPSSLHAPALLGDLTQRLLLREIRAQCSISEKLHSHSVSSFKDNNKTLALFGDKKMDKSWMTSRNRMSSQYREGVDSFLEFATKNVGPELAICCPCVNCLNGKKHSCALVKIHLIRFGISKNYKTWNYHGEQFPSCQPTDNHDTGEIVGSGLAGLFPENEDQLPEMLEEIFMGGVLDDDIDELPAAFEREDVRNFDKLFEDAQRKVFPGSNSTILSFIVKMLHTKVHGKLSNHAFDMMMQVIKSLLPVYDEFVPWNIREAKKLLRDLGLGYVRIDA